ncbi:adenosylcobinamide-phosphate synthase CbiB [Desulforamulus putei]|uniref:Cobalamin biosynthesis protein CobD n=1 Tax=Desulforamulus putei DSM 12395 TaxID=1121429 RepID=A0A1M4TYA2_9FIRM|nr:adenosylcobinamide-phosphate synthase CbiB [Desulforamulus putei]SHE49374.1 adenosylcobinamide-phosphate synthase [Desulforamulus putei DSM 12395]
MSVLILAALLIDLLVGDPRCLPHPVVLMGSLIQKCEALIRKTATDATALRIGGVLLVIAVCTVTYFITQGLIWLAGTVHPWLGLAVHLWLLSTTLAVKSLHQHARAVAEPLARGDIVTARQKVSLIVGRDCENLNEREITRATVETVAENTVDGIVSPLFYAFIGGAPLAMTYKAINTMDSMIGHRHQDYLYLGWAAARLDDLANYLPARLAGVFYSFLSIGSPGGFTSTVRAVLRDAPAHPSPNSGIPEAAVAGALGIQLGGTNYYRGEASHRPFMGKEKYPLTYRHIQQALHLTYGVTALTVLAGVLVRFVLESRF